jgi:predicted transcriptional regulator
MINPDQIANDFLEFASSQRLSILLKLLEKQYTVSKIARELDATVPEVFRNCERLSKAGLIEKGQDGAYTLTTYGKTVCEQFPYFAFMSKERKYFKTHDLGDLPAKFIQRLGALDSAQHVTGFVKVMELCNDIYKNSNQFIYNILSEIWYNQDIIDTIVDKLNRNVVIRSVFSESAIIPKERKKVIEKIDFKKYIQKGTLERKMKKIGISVILNEKEACIMFPTNDGAADLREMFYSDEPVFHEWCHDFFRFCWENSGVFREDKLRSN